MKMNILNISMTDEGGAGIASRNINDFFLKNAYNSTLLVRESTLKNENVIVIKKAPKNLFELYLDKVRYRLKIYDKKVKVGPLDPKDQFHGFDEGSSTYSARKILKYVPFNPDVIVLHWICDFIVSKTIKELTEISGAKVFWIMMDNAPLTGGCNYPWTCEGFYSNCSGCPAILSPSKKKIAERNLSLKKKYLPDTLRLIACSETDYKRATRSSVFKGKRIHKLLLPVDEHRFIPGDKNVSKSFFGINPKKKIIFYGASSLSEIRKGVQFFIDAIKILKLKLIEENRNPEEVLILVAGKESQGYFQNIGIAVHQVGRLNEEKLIKAYQAADVFVCTSIEDSGPMMINQSIMCSTPVVAFETGVTQDLVHTGKTGYRARLSDSMDVANGISAILKLDENEYRKMSNNCRELGLEKCSYKSQIEMFQNIFEN